MSLVMRPENVRKKVPIIMGLLIILFMESSLSGKRLCVIKHLGLTIPTLYEKKQPLRTCKTCKEKEYLQLTAGKRNAIINPSDMIGKRKGHYEWYGKKSCGGNVGRR